MSIFSQVKTTHFYHIYIVNIFCSNQRFDVTKLYITKTELRSQRTFVNVYYIEFIVIKIIIF